MSFWGGEGSREDGSRKKNLGSKGAEQGTSVRVSQPERGGDFWKAEQAGEDMRLLGQSCSASALLTFRAGELVVGDCPLH